jgi:hypothetical protein
MAMGSKTPAMAMDTNQCPGTAMDQRPAMAMASNQGLTIATNRRCPGTVTDPRPAMVMASNRRLTVAASQRPATATHQRPGADALLERQPIRQMKMPLRCRRTCPHLLLVDDDRQARALRLRWEIRLLREMNSVRYIHKLAHSPLCGDSNCRAGEFRESTFGPC